MTSDLDHRSGWSEELKGLLARHPRPTWSQARSPIAQFWLDRHEEFRRTAVELQAMTRTFRAGRKSPEELAGWTAPRLHAFLASLHGHHQIEDFHYFPAFREARKELAVGFDVLASDHELLHRGIIEMMDTFNSLLVLAGAPGAASRDALLLAGERYVDVVDVMLRRLARHLDDEEDLIIPVMLDENY